MYVKMRECKKAPSIYITKKLNNVGKGEFFETKLCLKELFLQHHCGTRKPFITTLCDFFYKDQVTVHYFSHEE